MQYRNKINNNNKLIKYINNSYNVLIQCMLNKNNNMIYSLILNWFNLNKKINCNILEALLHLNIDISNNSKNKLLIKIVNIKVLNNWMRKGSIIIVVKVKDIMLHLKSRAHLL